MKCARTDFHIQRLEDYAAVAAPEVLQAQNKLLKSLRNHSVAQKI